jgi:hypothetical protein
MKNEDSNLKAVTLKGTGYKISMAAAIVFDTGKAVPGTTKLASAANTLPLLP